MGFMALLSHQTAPVAVVTPVPAIIEAPEVKGESHSVSSGQHTAESAAVETSPSTQVTTTSFINPNQSFMDTHAPENTPEPVEVEKVDTKPEYIAPAEETPGHVNGTEYSTKGY